METMIPGGILLQEDVAVEEEVFQEETHVEEDHVEEEEVEGEEEEGPLEMRRYNELAHWMNNELSL